MKKFTFIFCFIASFTFAQNPGFSLLKKINGVDVFYKVSKTKEEAKKDTWLIEFEYVNSTGRDIFYKGTSKKDDGVWGTGKDIMISYFALVSIKNAKALSLATTGDTDISGDKTRLQTDKGEPIYLLKKGKTYTRTMDYRNDKGIEPLVTIMIENNITFLEGINELL